MSDDLIVLDDHTTLDEDDESNPYFEGGTLFSYSDRESVAHKLAIYDAAISAAIKKERELLSKVTHDSDRTIGVEVQFRRYTLPSGTVDTSPVMIVKEKPNRTDTVIVCYTDGVTVYLGLHSGISIGGPDTVAIVGSTGGTARTIKTRRALYAIASASAVIDIQEEFA